VVKDPQGEIILMTFMVIGLQKEDMLSQVSISTAIEKEREINPYYLTSTGILMGSIFTEGNHLYLNRESPYWKMALKALIKELYQEQEVHNASSILLRDLDAHDQELAEFMVEQDFVKIDLPESGVLEHLNWETEEEYKSMLSRKNRKHFMQEIKRNEHFFEVEVTNHLPDETLEYAITLFKNVKKNNIAINNFLFPDKLFYQINQQQGWEFIVLYVKEEYSVNRRPVSVCFCHLNADHVYSPALVGMDYDYLLKYGIYRQTLYQVIKRARALNCKKVNFGISASMEKKKVGATLYPKVGYFQAKDNFAMEMMEATIAIENE
jgi:hypothetical protein